MHFMVTLMHKRDMISMASCDDHDSGHDSMAHDCSRHDENGLDSRRELWYHSLYCSTFECWKADDRSARML